jgi:glutamine amidotransferase
MIVIVDYGMGNLRSVRNAFDMLGATCRVSKDPGELRAAERIVLPGVGAFRDCLHNLRQTGFAEALEAEVVRGGKPFLGICLGLQALARRSFEDGEHTGLAWFEADVVRLRPEPASLRVPQIGWNGVRYEPACPLFRGIPQGADFYFVHSYHMHCDHAAEVRATCDHGGAVTAAVARGNVFATQFHPEKSQEHGLKLLDNFLHWSP